MSMKATTAELVARYYEALGEEEDASVDQCLETLHDEGHELDDTAEAEAVKWLLNYRADLEERDAENHAARRQAEETGDWGD